MLLLSTDSKENLAEHNSELISFHRKMPGLHEESLLELPERWFVGSKTGCSCCFRHLYVNSVELDFGEPENWLPESNEEIEATLKFINIIRKMVMSDAKVECIDAWDHGGERENLSGNVEVNLSEISNAQFRFYENHRFIFTQKT